MKSLIEALGEENLTLKYGPLAPTIGQIFEIEFCPILLFWTFFTLKSDQNYLQFKFNVLVSYLVNNRGPKNFGWMGSYIRIPYSKYVQGGPASVGSFGSYIVA